MPESAKDISDRKAEGWVSVQVNLFDYPLIDGQRPVLLGNQCKDCGKVFFPKRSLCPDCFDHDNMEDIELETRGVIYASTVVHVDSPAGIKAPYAYGYVDLPGNQIRVFALFTGADPASFKPDQEVELILEPLGTNRDGHTVIGYKFRPISE